MWLRAQETSRPIDTKATTAYLEVWYHVAAMLSCRFSGPGSVQYNRRLASADCIIELTSCGKDQSLPPLPLIPYAMSMALAVTYRALRDNQRDFHTAYEKLVLCCNALDAMNKRWTSITRVIQLGQRLLKHLNKPGVMNAHVAHANDDVREECGAGPSVVATADNLLTLRHQRDNRCANAEQEAKSPTGPGHTHGAMQSDHTLYVDENSQQHSTELWPEIDASYFQLDRAIYDLFDDSIPIASQDPAVWNDMHFAMNESSHSSHPSHDFQLTPNLTSLDSSIAPNDSTN